MQSQRRSDPCADILLKHTSKQSRAETLIKEHLGEIQNSESLPGKGQVTQQTFIRESLETG